MASLPFPAAELEHPSASGRAAEERAFQHAFERTLGRRAATNRGPAPIVGDWIASPLGPLFVAAVDDGVCLVEFSDPARLEVQVAALHRHFGGPIVVGEHRHLAQLRAELAGYFAGSLREFGAPLVHPGSAFQRAVWDRLRQIPYGATVSYEALARDVGAPGAQRAVGRANGQNRVSIVIPCHRVVNKSGRLGGYGAGLWRKEWLLDLERRAATGSGCGA
jgi:AraC family transcriptional regulator of adaptative response/methylated-DNA-[protein]-cysteine methyltransferase